MFISIAHSNRSNPQRIRLLVLINGLYSSVLVKFFDGEMTDRSPFNASPNCTYQHAGYNTGETRNDNTCLQRSLSVAALITL